MCLDIQLLSFKKSCQAHHSQCENCQLQDGVTGVRVWGVFQGCGVKRGFEGRLHVTGVRQWWRVRERGRLWMKTVWWAQSRNCHVTLFQATVHEAHHTRTAQQHKDSESLIQRHLLDIPSHRMNAMKQPAVALTSSSSKCHSLPTHQPEHVSSQASAKCQSFNYFL